MTASTPPAARATGLKLLAVMVLMFIVPFAYKLATGPSGPPLPTVQVVRPVGQVSLAEAGVMSWHAVPLARRYDVELLNEEGQSVLGRSVHDTTFVVPSGTLQPGAGYIWTLRVLLPDTQVVSQPQRFRITP